MYKHVIEEGARKVSNECTLLPVPGDYGDKGWGPGSQGTGAKEKRMINYKAEISCAHRHVEHFAKMYDPNLTIARQGGTLRSFMTAIMMSSPQLDHACCARFLNA